MASHPRRRSGNAEERFEVVILPDARREYSHLPKPVRTEFSELVADLADDPFIRNAALMRNATNTYRIYLSGSYRVIYRVVGRKVTVIRVRPRGRAYSGFERD